MAMKVPISWLREYVEFDWPLEELARKLVDDPDAVRVEQEQRDDVLVLRLHVAKDDVGKVIGRQGRIARALRQLVRAYSGQQRTRVLLEIAD
jgi:predicted RNA-binding protein YlqC (UPF0109 family)